MRNQCGVRAGVNRASRWIESLFALVYAGLACAGSAHAEDTSEFWPEISAFTQLNERSRAYFDAAYALGKESDVKSLNLAACLDVSLRPVARMRKDLLTQDWQRIKYQLRGE